MRTTHESSNPSGAMRALVETTPDLASLKAYNKAKQAMANELRSLRQLLADEAQQQAADGCRELLAKLAEDRFTVAVVGQFKRGKSSLMNAIIGRDLLPTGVLPVTSAITMVTFGPQELLVVERDKALFAEEVPMQCLADYVTEQGNPGNQKRVKCVRIQAPAAFLRQGLEFVDTPGVGSAIQANTATTYEFLPQCDAVLFVTGADAPLTATEMELLAKVQTYARKVVIVVNKMDLVPEPQRRGVVEFVVHTIQRDLGGEARVAFPLSCLMGMQAKQTQDEAAYEASGLRALEEELGIMLSTEKRSTFLLAVLDKALRLMDQSAATRPQADKNAARWTRLASRLRELGQRLESGSAPEQAPAAPPLSADEPLAAVSPTPAVESDLLSDLRDRGCPVCNHVRQAASDYLSHYQYALSSDEAERDALAAEAGLCRSHMWQLFAMSSPQGMSWGYPRLMEGLAAHLAEMSRTPDRAAQEFDALYARLKQCRLCKLLAGVEQAYVQQLADGLSEGECRGAYAKSQGLCLRHLRDLVRALRSTAAVEFVLAHAASRFEEFAEDMRCYATKHEALRRGLMNSDEQTAHVRAMLHLAGHEYLSCLPDMPGGGRVQ